MSQSAVEKAGQGLCDDGDSGVCLLWLLEVETRSVWQVRPSEGERRPLCKSIQCNERLPLMMTPMSGQRDGCEGREGTNGIKRRV